MALVAFDRKTFEFTGLDDKILEQLKRTYPHIYVEQELEKMKLWLLSAKGSRRRGNLQFISRWLGRAEPSSPVALNNDQSVLRAVEEELASLHRDREWLHELNTKR